MGTLWKLKTSIIVFLLLCLTASAFTITEPQFIVQLRKMLNIYLQDYSEEKIYLQTDKTLYKPGEYLFFTSFLTDAVSGKASDISDVSYVELYDPKGSLVQKLCLNMKDGMATGQFLFNEAMPGGMYKLKAYTKWMINFGEDRCFEKDIQVQQVITPRLLLKVDFQKKAYGKGDRVIADLNVSDLKNDKANNATVKCKINIAGKLFKEFTVNTDKEGKVSLEFDLPGNLNTTDVLLQAIVSYQGLEESISRSVPVVLDKISMSFFPEGGRWVAGTTARLAFEALNEFGKGADVSGEIVDQYGNPITTFESFHFGMGAFDMQAEADKHYFARILKPKGNDSLFALPTVFEGYSLNLRKNDRGSLTWNVFSPEAGDAFLVVRVHGEMLDNKYLKLEKGNNNIAFDTEKLPGGIAVFTLFANNQPQCERLVMVNPDKQFNIKIKTDKDYYAPGEEVIAEIETTDHLGKPVPATMGFAVVDEQLLTMADDKQDNILTYIMLSSELKGKIYEPSFYFDKKEKKSPEAIDYLLLTHGWRMYQWEDVYSQKKRNMNVPENIGSGVYGFVINKDGQAVKSEVYLLEMNNKRRALKLITSDKGQFAFFNTDPSSPLVLFTKKPNHIRLIDKSEAVISALPKSSGSNEDIKTILGETESPFTKLPTKNKDVIVVDELMGIVEEDLQFGDNENALQEVVVVGYGVQKKKSLTGAVVQIVKEEIAPPVEVNLAGQVAGMEVLPPNINPEGDMKIRIRGAASTVNNNNPLIVVDGVLMSENNDNFLDLLNWDNVESISVLKDAVGTSLYGARAANGVLVVSTKNPSFPFRCKTVIKEKNPVYSFSYIPAKSKNYSFHFAQSYYNLMPRKAAVDNERSDFRTTVYWNGLVKTDAKGKGRVRYYNNDANSAFRITAEGLSNEGLIGRVEYTYSTQMPLALDVKLPNYMNYSDEVHLSVTVRNNTKKMRVPEISINCGEGLILEGGAKKQVEIDPDMSSVVEFTIKSAAVQGKFSIELHLSEGDFSDVMKHTLEVYPVGFPKSKSISGKDFGKSESFLISDLEQGSISGEITLLLSTTDEMFAGMESILREPYGCFEQVSSVTFPNIYATQLMKATSGKEELQERALKYIANGYSKQMGYEINKGGFEWFGKPPANEALTAYGLVEFVEMNKIYGGVGAEMVERTKQWLLDRRNPDGSFIQTTGKWDLLSKAPYTVNCAYVLYALSEINTRNIENSYQLSYDEVLKSKDLYRAALMALAAKNMKKEDDYSKLLSYFIEYASKNKTFNDLKVESTIVSSRGQSAVVEIVALWATALMRSSAPDLELIDRCINFLIQNRSGYGYGSTQATSLSLKALTDYALGFHSSNSEGYMNVIVNGKEYPMSFTKETKASVVSSDFVKALKEGNNDIKLDLKSDSKIPYSLVMRWNSKTPESSNKCPLKLTTELAQSEVKLNETVRLSIKMKNITTEGQPMSIAVIGIPAGLSPQVWQLKEMQEKGVFDFYEYSGNRLAFFYRAMLPSAEKVINLDLKADIAGSYSGAASSAYLYYTQEYRNWVKGMEVKIVK